MKKLIPLMVCLVLFLILLVSWKNIFSYKDDMMEEFNRHIANAEILMNKEIYIDAVKEYEAALKIQPENYEIAKTIVDLYDTLDIPDSYVKALKNAIKSDPQQKEPYLKLADYYLDTSSWKQAYDVLGQGWDAFPGDEEINSRMVIVKSQYTIAGIDRLPLSGPFYSDSGSSGYMLTESEGLYGIMNTSCRIVIPCEYEYIGVPVNKLIPVKKNGEYYYIDSDGYRKLVPDTPAEYYGSFGNGYAPAAYNGKYGYVDKNLKEYHFEYDEAGCFSNGIAAVRKGNKWAVINSSFKTVTEYIFDEIMADDFGYIAMYGVFFAKRDGKYALYNLKGEKISEEFEDACLFVSDEPAAVKKNGKWGFVTKKGEVITEFKYDDAGSFCVGYAPVMIKGKWGYIDTMENVLIEPQFDQAGSFMRNGYSYVMLNDLYENVVVRILD